MEKTGNAAPSTLQLKTATEEIPQKEIEYYLMGIDEYTQPNIIFERLISVRNRHSRGTIVNVEKDFVGFYGGKDSPLKFFYFPRESSSTPTTWDDCYVGMSLPLKPYARFKKATEEMGTHWTESIYDIEDTRLRFDDKTQTVFIKVGRHFTYVFRTIT